VDHFSSLTVRRRVAVLFLSIVVLVAGLIIRLGYLQLWQGDNLLDMALAQRVSPVPLLPNRGTIYDTNLKPLATSISAEAVYAVPIEVEDMDNTASALASVLNTDKKWLLEQLQKQARTVWLG